MTDDAIDMALETPAETRDWFRRKVGTEGLRVAYQAAIDVCRDPRAQASARATAAGWLMRASGVVAKAEEPDDKDPSTMTRAEMLREYDRLTREVREAERVAQQAATGPSGGAGSRSVFD